MHVPARVRVVHVPVPAAEGKKMSIFSFFRPNAKTTFPLEKGLYRFPNVEEKYHLTLHLRVEQDQHSSLIINANTIIHLNQTATWMTYLILSDCSLESAMRQLSQVFSTTKSTLERDYQQIYETLNSILDRGHLCFNENPAVETLFPFEIKPSAPYRMDLALTYQCNNNCFHCYNEPDRESHSLSFQEWKAIIDRLWELGIPHIVFTGGEPTLFPELISLIEYAKGKGLVTGLNTNGRRLSYNGYAQSLGDAGLDHIQITIESSDPSIHDLIVQKQGAWQQTVAGITQALKTDLFVMTNTTLLRENVDTLPQTLALLSSLGVPTIGLNALIFSGRGRSVAQLLSESELFPILEFAKQFVESSGQKLIWYTPTHYCNFDPMDLSLGIKGCTAALYNMCVEPNGTVLPCQSYYHSLGNILHDQWETIWHHPLAESLRHRRLISNQCEDCLLLAQCGGGCPLSPSHIALQSFSRIE